MPDFWFSCGYRLLAQRPDNFLGITPQFLRSYLLRPELAPLPDSSAAELALHERLYDDPDRVVAEAEVAAIADPDARENFRLWLRFRDRLLAAPNLEAAYAQLFAGAGVDVAPPFVQQLTQILLRHMLGEDADPLLVRAAEMLFRTQKISVADGAVLAADEETVQTYATSGGFGSLGELLAGQGTPLRTIELDVLSEDNRETYWERDERFDVALRLNRGEAALEAFCRVLERWIAHFLKVETTIEPQSSIEDGAWVWHVGLDAQASSILNDLYNRQDVDEERMSRLLCLFVLRFKNPADMRQAIAGRPVYLAMAMDPDQELKLKPQNLLLNLPLARQST